ncbi:hypothetical protein IJV79_04165, partial [bacterium]|nr:hypothetical protein [bacterium]
FVVVGKQQIIGGVEVESFNDHRIAMCLYIAGLIAQKAISIKGFECVNISFPRFEELINLLQRPHFRLK